MIAGKLRWNTSGSVYGADREVESHIFFGLDQNANFVWRLAVATNGLKIRIWKESSECNKEPKTIDKEEDGHKKKVPIRFSAPSVLFAMRL
jgi:hypothetical protein